MVNIADLDHRFGELAGINVEKSVPRPIDGVRMMPYVLNPQHAGIRKSNFTQVGAQHPGERRDQRSLHDRHKVHADPILVTGVHRART